MELVHMIYSDKANVVEQIIHAIFRNKPYRNTQSWEWFDLDDDDVEWFKSLRFIDSDTLEEAARNLIGLTASAVLFRGRGQ